MPFRCDRCARCCRHHVVPVTRADVARLATHTHLDPAEFLDLRRVDEVDLIGEPESLAELPGGDRLAVLLQKDGACVFLEPKADGTEVCRVHPARPLSCRAYPFDRPRGAESVGVHPAALCPPATGHLAVVEAGGRDAADWANIVRDRDRELSEHAEWLADFNRRQRRRRRLGKTRRGARDFLVELAPPRSTVLGDDAAHPAQVPSTEQVQVHEERIELMKR